MSQNKIINFFGKRWIFFGISIAIMIVGIIGMFTNGVKLDLQFKGGAMLKYTYEGTIDADKVGDIASALLERPVTTNLTADLATDTEKLVINIAGDYGLDAAMQTKLESSLSKEFPDAKLKLDESTMVEPYFGKKFLTNGIIALLLSSVLVMMYVWFRFSKIGGLSAGAMAIVALCHDVAVVFFTCVLFKIPIGDSFIAVALSIIGYSVNDTIVIYDRIRENRLAFPSVPVDHITNLSISQSITRSINTNIAVFISVGMIYVMAFSHGINSIQSFALPMAIGAISGCYSTICIAGPLWVMWQKRKEKVASAN